MGTKRQTKRKPKRKAKQPHRHRYGRCAKAASRTALIKLAHAARHASRVIATHTDQEELHDLYAIHAYPVNTQSRR